MSVFGILDYLSVLFTLGVSLSIGVYHAYKIKENGTDEILVGGRKMDALPVAISMLVTFLSATSIIGFPAEIYQSGIQLFFMKICLLPITMSIAAYIFMIVLYDLKITSVYQYLQLRFDSASVRMLASSIYIVQCSIITGISLYAPSILLETFFGFPTWISLIIIGFVGLIYTSFGGFKAVIWTDVFQFILIIIGMLAITIKGFISTGGINESFYIAKTHGRLNIFDWTVDIFQHQNTLNIFIGLFVSQIGFFGTHQAHVMRYCSLPTFKDSLKSMAWKGILQTITQCLIICTGVAIIATYVTCDPLILGAIKKIDQIVPYFFTTELSNIPGMMGIFTSCILSAVLSTYSSMLNSLAAVTYSDFVTKLPLFKNMTEKRRVKSIMMLTALYGLIITSISLIVGKLGSIFRLLYVFIGAFGGTISATFFIGLLVPFANRVGAFAGLIAGSIITGYIALQGFLLKTHSYSLERSTDSCPMGTNLSSVTNISVFGTHSKILEPQNEWPAKLFTVSYLLYPAIGSIITIMVCLTVSFITNQFMDFPEVDTFEEYLHPMVQSLRKRRKCKSSKPNDKFKNVEFKFLKPRKDSMVDKRARYAYAEDGILV